MLKLSITERDLLVHANWAVLGLCGTAFLLEGFATDSFLLSLVGICVIVAGFIAHMVINAIAGTAFSSGETALGMGLFGIAILVFIAAWLQGALSMSDYWSGLALFAVLTVGLPVYMATRYGLRGAFSHFHKTHDPMGKAGK
ncbi:hypothetical protein [Cohaesibacter intestini]|nr:hypothetical protein [Cohaesibacter intestini]